MKNNPGVFDCDMDFRDSWVRLHTVGVLLEESDNDIRWDEKETKNRIVERLNHFAQNDFDPINEAIKQCLEEYRAEGHHQPQ